GNEGVAARIKISEASIGYVEYGFAKRLGLPMAALQNKAGEFVPPSEAAAQLALSARTAHVRELERSIEHVRRCVRSISRQERPWVLAAAGSQRNYSRPGSD